MMQGCNQLADAVQVTLGPSGRNVLIDNGFGGAKITKDGVTVAKAIDFSDKFMNVGANLVKSVASKTNDSAGDGTTTATVLARAILKHGLAHLEEGNATLIRKGINRAVDTILEELKKASLPVRDTETVKNVARISANGDEKIGAIIAQLY